MFFPLSVDDIRNIIEDALLNPLKHAYILRAHDKAIKAAQAASNSSKKRKRADADSPDLPIHPEAESFADGLRTIKLASWA